MAIVQRGRGQGWGILRGQRDADIIYLSVLLERKHANKDVRIAWWHRLGQAMIEARLFSLQGASASE